MKKTTRSFEIRFYSGLVKRKPDYVDALIPLAEAYTREGLYEEGLEVDKRLSQLCQKDPVVHYNLACSYALVGNHSKAIETLSKAIKIGYDDFDHMRQDKDLKSLHGDDAFERLFS